MKVLSIVGCGRSGSTVVGNVLGEVPGVFSAGELHHFWGRGLLEGWRCGCGERAIDCGVWAKVLARVHDHLDVPLPSPAGDVDPLVVAGWQGELSTLRVRRRILSARSCDGWPALQRYVAAQGALLEAIGEATGARVVVDSSKRPQDAVVASLAPGIEHYVLHLVRDPRAVAHSWSRRKSDIGPSGSPTQMGTKRPVRSALRWLENNAGAELVRRRTVRSRWMRLRYEEFALRPRETMQEVCRFLGEDPAGLPFEDERTVSLSVNHTVSGNPDRYRTGLVSIREDGEWRSHLSPRTRFEVTLLTAVALSRYDYPLLRSSSEPAS
jgi:hypothetical protein